MNVYFIKIVQLLIHTAVGRQDSSTHPTWQKGKEHKRRDECADERPVHVHLHAAIHVYPGLALFGRRQYFDHVHWLWGEYVIDARGDKDDDDRGATA